MAVFDCTKKVKRMKKICVFTVVCCVPVALHASALDGVCFNSYGWGYRGGEYATTRCIIDRNLTNCAACRGDSTEFSGCDGGCNGQNVGVPGYYTTGMESSGFKCTSDGVWVPTNSDCNETPVKPTQTVCGQAQYRFKYSSADSQWYCADCPSPGMQRADGGDIKDCILSDSAGDTGIESCTLSSMVCPSLFADSTGQFQIYDPGYCSYSK